MEKKSAKKIIKKIFYKLCFWQSKVIEFIEKGRVRKNKESNVDNDLCINENAEKLKVVIADVYGNCDGIVTIVSDDGFYESGVLLNKLLKKYELRATVAGAVDFVKPYLKEWKKIISEGYIEMVSHSYKHVALREEYEISQEKDRLYYEIVRSAKWHEKNFPENGKQIVFVCPEGAICELGNKVLYENGFYAVRRAGQGYNTLFPNEGTERGEWFSLNVKGICENGVNEEVRRKWIDIAANENLWLIEMWHNVMEKQDGFYQTILKDEAEDHLKYISKLQKEGRIWVATLTDATKYIHEKQVADANAYLSDKGIYVLATLKDKNLDKDIFVYPITIKIELPDNLVNFSFYIGENELAVVDERTLILDVVPNGEIVEITIKSKTSVNRG